MASFLKRAANASVVNGLLGIHRVHEIFLDGGENAREAEDFARDFIIRRFALRGGGVDDADKRERQQANL